MIQVRDDGHGVRHYTVPAELAGLAVEVCPGLDRDSAVHRLMRWVPADELATIGALLRVDQSLAKARARAWLGRSKRYAGSPA